MKISLSRPDITELEIKYVNDVLRSPFLSLGPKLIEFEKKMAQYIGCKHAIAVNSGTSGLHLCIKALGISDGDGVITTPFSFIASANCILYEKARPVFIDIDKYTFNLDPDKIEAYLESTLQHADGFKIKAILPVHVFGRPCEMDKIMDIADKYNLIVIEDACEALGAEYRFNSPAQWKKVGSIGNVAVFAFYPNKQITTGEGGIIVTNDERLASLIRSLRNQGRNDNGGWLTHVRLGFNYRLSDINCALGIAQMERIDEILTKRDGVASLYNYFLSSVEDIHIPYISAKTKISWFVYVVKLNEVFDKDDRDEILKGLIERGIGCNNYFPPLHLQPFFVNLFGYKRGDLPITEKISERTIALPFHNNLTMRQVEYVCMSLKHELLKQKMRKYIYQRDFPISINKSVEYELYN